MFKKPVLSISNLLILSVIIVVLGALYFLIFFRQNSSWELSRNHFNQALEAAALKLETRWKEGDIEGFYSEGKFTCPDLIQNNQKIHSSYFQCNPYYMICFLREKTSAERPLEFEEFSFEFLNHQFDRRGRLVVGLRDKGTGKQAGLKFLDTCSKVHLPSSVYSAGPLEESSVRWDNVGQNLFLDKHYVTNGKVKIWLDSLGREKDLQPGDFHKPSLDLSFQEKKRYCAFKGGQLLQSRQFDAATFLPARGENNYIYKFPYPWTKRKDAIVELNGKNCAKIFSKECPYENYEYHSTYGSSWSGIYHALGSHVEIFDNKIFPPARLKLSSKDLPLASPWHRLGLRAGMEKDDSVHGYNGVELEAPDFEPLGFEKRSAFRCVFYR